MATRQDATNQESVSRSLVVLPFGFVVFLLYRSGIFAHIVESAERSPLWQS